MVTPGNVWLATWLNTLKSTLGGDLLESIAHIDDDEHEDPRLVEATALIGEEDLDKIVDETFVAISSSMYNNLGLTLIDIPNIMMVSAMVTYIARWYTLGVARGLGAEVDWLYSLGSTSWYQDSIVEAMDMLSSIVIDDDGQIRPANEGGEERIINPFA